MMQVSLNNLSLGRGWNRGRKLSEEHRRKISEAHKGKVIPTETRKIMSEKAKGKHSNEKNAAWKGDEAGYTAIHKWLFRKRGKASFCENDKKHKGPYVWANISGEYKRDLLDYRSSCASCNKTDGVRKAERFL